MYKHKRVDKGNPLFSLYAALIEEKNGFYHGEEISENPRVRNLFGLIRGAKSVAMPAHLLQKMSGATGV